LRDALGNSAFTRRHLIRRYAPTLLAALLAVAYLIVQPAGADLPAQLLRVKLFAAQGFGIWNNWWYGGHYLLGYSVLFPPLGWLLGARLLGALASVATATAFAVLAYDVYGEEAWLGATWLGAATVTELLSGRLTFALGLCSAALTALFLERRQPRWAAVLAGVTALASPVAALFVALAGLVGRRPSVILASLLPVALLTLAFPSGGYQPFAFGALWPLLAASAFILLLRPGATISTATVLYAAGCLLAFAVHSAVGSNVARLGDLVAGPLVALVLVPRRAWLLLALAALPLTYLQIHDAVTDLEHGMPDRSASYYQPLIRFLRAQPGVWRVEVPATQGHWESYWLAPQVPLARGWERQTDIGADPLFYEPGLSAGRYESWLHRLAVRYVAVADAPGDYSALAELRLIRGGLPYLRVVRRLRHWTVYEVADATAIASGAGRVVSIAASSVRLAVARSGNIYLRLRWSPYWQLSGVRGCVLPAGRFTRINASTAGAARLSMSFSLARVGSRRRRCDWPR
jgi:hypothetical protein